ncbi:hypothetical protein [Desulfoplanes sp.]
MTLITLNRGLVDAALIVKLFPGYWAITARALAIQFATAWLVFVLTRKHFFAGTSSRVIRIRVL